MHLKRSIIIATALFVVIKLLAAQGESTTVIKRPVDMVNPFVDAANSRWFFFSSACRPFGMVNLSPDMGLGGAWDSGYRYKQDTIRFFSHIHAWQLSGVPVLPTTGEFKGHLGPRVYGSKYSHQQEEAAPGYHSVLLEGYGIKAELTSTTRVGFHRYTFPESKESNILIDLGTVLGPSGTDMGFVKRVSDQRVDGYALMSATRRRPKATPVYFSIELNKPVKTLKAWKNGELLGKTEKFEGANGGVYFHYETGKDEQVLMKVGVSYVSSEQARLNLETELPHWDFDKVVGESKEVWNDYLGRIKVEGNTEKQQGRFYTDLWHALQGRRIISDVNGQYADMTGEKKRTGQIPLDENGKPKFNHYNSDAFWGAQWTLNTLWHLVYPEISEEFVNSMLLMYDDGGHIPRGPSGGNYTYVMTGASSTPFIVSAYMKGIRGFNVEKAYEGMRKNAMPGGIMGKVGYEHETTKGGGLEYYLERGYVPYPLAQESYGFHQDGPGVTLEYAYQDWCLAQMAKALNKTEDYKYFLKRAENYKNVYDTTSGWMRARTMEGKWQEPFDHLLYSEGFVEATPAEATWFVPHDLKGLSDLMGGHELASQKLERSFLIAEPHGFVAHAYKADKVVNKARHRTYINYGNQPSMQTAFVFNYFGKPRLTQEWSRKIVDLVYSDNDPYHGYNGDEDQGLMGSLAVLMKIGLFQMRGGAATDPVYEIGSPIFDKVIINLNKEYYQGKEFIIECQNNSSTNKYIQSAMLEGETMNKSWFTHQELIEGGVLRLEMGGTANESWGIGGVPPSMSDVNK